MAIAACGDPVEDKIVAHPVQESRMLVEAYLPMIADIMVESANRQAISEALADRIAAEAARPFADRVQDGLRYSTVFQREYVEAEMELIFADRWGLTPEGEHTLEVLADVERHAIEVETLHEERIRDSRERLVEIGEYAPLQDDFRLTAIEAELLIKLVAARIEDNEDDVGLKALINTLSIVEDEEVAPSGLQRLKEFIRNEADHFAEPAQKIAELELWVADGALRYAREMRHSELNRVDWRQMRDAGGSAEIIFSRLQNTLNDLADASAAEVRDVFTALEPSHPQYRALLGAADRYRKIVEAGGWENVRPFTVEMGATSAAVAGLRTRLEAEGFRARWSSAEQDEEFDPRVVDATLVEAVRRYQETHQFEADAVPTPGFWRSLNLSAEHRLAQIELTLQRWRESHLEDDENYILVNIPSFEAEVWTDGEEKLRFTVVVGRNHRRCDQDAEQWVYPDATPEMMHKMDHLMLNPPWFVPDRLVRETLMPRLEENPDYFEQEGFETIELSDGSEAVRQVPGPDNALGLVKFIFPNEHNVYLHDTPHKQLFENRIRAYSHGCIRVSKPLELAEHLLDWMGRSDIDIDEVLESGRTRKVDFERDLPVLVEYYTVWVDEDGIPNFLADTYRRDARRMSDDAEEFDRCTPAAPAPTAPEIEVDDETLDDVENDLGP